MEIFARAVHSKPYSVKVAYTQGFFEGAGEVDWASLTLQATVRADLVCDIVKVLTDLDVTVSIVEYADPFLISVSLESAKRIPLLNPAIKNGKYYDMLACPEFPFDSAASPDSGTFSSA
jgi:hypothetical protein